MKLLTEVTLPQYGFRIDHRSSTLLMGSCFTENIGRIMERALFPVCINPFGVTYNPVSVLRGLDALLNKDAYIENDLDQYDGMWFSFDHYTGFSSPDREASLSGINSIFAEAKKVLAEAKLLVLTWGTSWVYRYNETGNVVCNCHKIPANRFTRSRLTTEEIVETYTAFLPSLFQANPDLKVLLTVSPVRHWKDGAHGNQVSKAALLIAAEALADCFAGRVSYFPSYEIVMDELRDYRFYAADMLHMNQQATDYIWEIFSRVLVSDESKQIMVELEPLLRILEHHPRVTEGETYRNFTERKEKKLEELRNKYSFLSWSNMGILP